MKWQKAVRDANKSDHAHEPNGNIIFLNCISKP